MIPLTQTQFSNDAGTVHGNCFGTCVASLLEIDPATVPPFQDYGDGTWFPLFWDLLVAHGYRFLGTRIMRGRTDWPDDIGPGVDGYFIVGGGSPRGFARGHAVIYKDGVLVHDPHPSGAGLTEVTDIYMVAPESYQRRRATSDDDR